MAAAVSLLALAACQRTQAAVQGAPPPPPEVSVITVVPERVALTSEWIATLDGYVNAQIHPQVSGYLVNRNYREGAAVHKGDVLFEIDARPLNAVLTQAVAQVAQATAQLAKSARDVERDTPLAAQQAIAQSQLADRRRRCHRDRPDRRSGQTRYAPDDGLASVADQGVLRRKRAGLPTDGRTDQRRWQVAVGGRRRADADPRRRQRVPATRLVPRRRPRDRSEDR